MTENTEYPKLLHEKGIVLGAVFRSRSGAEIYQNREKLFSLVPEGARNPDITREDLTKLAVMMISDDLWPSPNLCN